MRNLKNSKTYQVSKTCEVFKFRDFLKSLFIFEKTSQIFENLLSLNFRRKYVQ